MQKLTKGEGTYHYLAYIKIIKLGEKHKTRKILVQATQTHLYNFSVPRKRITDE